MYTHVHLHPLHTTTTLTTTLIVHHTSNPPKHTDHLWWNRPRKRAFHPASIAPRCLPCHLDLTTFNHSAAPFPAPLGCPCTPQLLCQSDTRGIFDAQCNMPRVPRTTYSMHGGAGAVISVGLLRQISLNWMEGCVQSLTSTGMGWCGWGGCVMWG